MERPARVSPLAKLRLGLRVWYWFVVVRLGLRRSPLPELVGRLGRAGATSRRLDPVRLGRAVAGALRVGRLDPRCLFTALVLYRLLRQQGDPAELVIGLPREPKDKDAHAWVELHGVDVGPPPGRGLHEELARYR
jgi:hypothetical protein